MDGGDSESAFRGLGDPSLIDRMHHQLDELAVTRDQMEHLLAVILEMGSDLHLNTTLHRVVVAAMKLTSARYGALAIRGPQGNLIEFIHAGLDEQTIRRIGHLPIGKGVLDASLVESEPLRLADLTAHPAAVGFPEHHPPMRALLSVPLITSGVLIGNLYLTHEQPGRTFAESDEKVAVALATAAAVAVDNARMVEHLRASAHWIEASRDITTALLSDSTGPAMRSEPLQIIAERVCELASAEQAIVMVPADASLPIADVGTLTVAAAAGLNADEVIRQEIAVDGSTTGSVLRSGRPLITEALDIPIPGFTDVGQRPVVVVALRSDGETLGVLAIARNENHRAFDGADLDLVYDFAHRAAVAVVVARGRAWARERDILADRERIAHDLHDHVIQQLFAAGLDLQGTLALTHSPEVVARLDATIDDLQTIIAEIRTTIFRLKSRAALDGGFQKRVQDEVARLTENRTIVATVRVDGTVTLITDELAEHAEAVIMEAVSNACRHSGATRVSVEISVTDSLNIVITDNGHGIPADNHRHSGLANMVTRAQLLGGACKISSQPEGGTRVHWSAPLAGR
ncbi:GAF domain-containing protein [Mycolicibacter hiberniae]|uniref:Diguanylate cyclase n=1 Tax=Mycolicibacter hiberniae TaxID=29314 RepID=A0A7I7X0V7_9MYCO|nr:GAF domain-containing protein [Mycolicibacter hiberniae]ORV71472.1 histidine kinase [Mycolicibacter hiberniae]BBZ23324.1 diguanylate cyclase [Mycolicibacter hiberniae]